MRSLFKLYKNLKKYILQLGNSTIIEMIDLHFSVFFFTFLLLFFYLPSLPSLFSYYAGT